MAEYRCEPCRGLFVGSPAMTTESPWYPHHRTLFELQCCAKSHRDQCSVCQLLWNTIERQSSKDIQYYIDRRSVTHRSAKTDEYNPQLFLHIDLGKDLPANPSDNPSGRLRDHRIVDNTQCIRIYVNKVSSNWPYNILGAVGISVPSSSAAALELRGRNARESTSDQQHNERITIAEHWLKRCYKHKGCLGKIDTLLPKRLVDLRGLKPKLIEYPNGTHGIYAALSYYWGHDHNMYKLEDPEGNKPGNINDLKNEIEVKRLRLSQQHGIQVARELGYEYLWVDALCIIQNNTADWTEQSSCMLEIYGNADLTIVAGRSKHSNEGFLKLSQQTQTKTPSKVQLEYRSTAIQAYCDIDLLRNHEIGPVTERAWCFQEAKISRRRLIYGVEQLSFRCRDYHVFEDGHWESISAADPWYDSSFLARLRQQKVPQPPKPPQADYQAIPSSSIWDHDITMDGRFSSAIRRHPLLQSWYEMTSEFSSLGFYYCTDNHAALSGIALQVREALAEELKINIKEKEIYMAGLWTIELPVALLWRSSRIDHPHLPALKSPEREGAPVRRAPSWSWMELVGPITQGMHGWGGPGDEVVVPGEVLCAEAEPDGTWGPEPKAWHPLVTDYKKFPNPFRLKVEAYICEVRISQHNAKVFESVGDWRQYSSKSLHMHTVLLEVKDNKALSMINNDMSPEFVRIGARGLFDRQYTTQWLSDMWAMCVTTSEGLLLKKTTKNGAVEYERLGIFAIERMAAFFSESSLEGIGTKQCRVIKEKLDKEILVLI